LLPHCLRGRGSGRVLVPCIDPGLLVKLRGLRNLWEGHHGMHELSVVESMVAIVLRHAGLNRAKSVTRINMVLGEMSTVMEEPVRFYFDMVARETPAEGAELSFRRTPLVARCLECGEEFNVVEYDFTCSSCGGNKTEILSGREFQVESIEVSQGEGGR
jgi:hydrogenase nickel incorporation protein HypA/HybF